MGGNEQHHDNTVSQNTKQTRPLTSDHDKSNGHAQARPEPSYGTLTEGESNRSLWQTLRLAMRDQSKLVRD